MTKTKDMCVSVCVSVVLVARWAGAMFGPVTAAPDVSDCSTHPKEEEYEEGERSRVEREAGPLQGN